MKKAIFIKSEILKKFPFLEKEDLNEIIEELLNSYISLVQLSKDFSYAKKGEKKLIEKFRDLTLFNFFDSFFLVIACDSNAGIGLKLDDYVRKDFFSVGRSAVKVALMEVFASGAFPLIIIDTLGVEMDPAGKEIIRGIKYEVEKAGIDPSLALTGSTEDNMKTLQTCIGVTVIGLAKKDSLKLGKSQPGDIVVAVGIPKSAPLKPYTEDDLDIASVQTVQTLVKMDFIHEILPVGSKGISYEAKLLAETINNTIKFIGPAPLDLNFSAGTSTCVLVSLNEKFISVLKEKIKPKPINIIGYLSKKTT